MRKTIPFVIASKGIKYLGIYPNESKPAYNSIPVYLCLSQSYSQWDQP
jgi:hypothetical protein